VSLIDCACAYRSLVTGQDIYCSQCRPERFKSMLTDAQRIANAKLSIDARLAMVAHGKGWSTEDAARWCREISNAIGCILVIERY
jgi:hypothetical protein